MRSVALVQVDNDCREPLESTSARKRPRVERASGDHLARKIERKRLGLGIVSTDEGVLVRRLLSAQARGRERVKAGKYRRVQLFLQPLGKRSSSGDGSTPRGVKRSSEATERTGVLPIALRSSRAASSAASAFTARTTRSAARTASSFAAPSTPSSAAAEAARSRSREPMTTSRPASCSRMASALPNGPVPPTTPTRTPLPTRCPRDVVPIRGPSSGFA